MASFKAVPRRLISGMVLIILFLSLRFTPSGPRNKFRSLAALPLENVKGLKKLTHNYKINWLVTSLRTLTV